MWSHANSVWPRKFFARVPELVESSELAVSVRQAAFGSSDGGSWCDLRKVCLVGGFNLQKTKFVGNRSSHDALLVPKDNGSFVILVDPNRDDRPIRWDTERQRLRFRVAHEIGHSFFFDRTKFPAERVLAPSREEEIFCDNFASELLVPHTVARKYTCGPSSVFDIHDTFEVSVEASARALGRCFPQMTIVGTKWSPNPRTGRCANRVIWWTGPRFVPIGADLGSTIVDNTHVGGVFDGNEELKLGRLRGTFRVRAERRSSRTQCVAVIGPLY